MTSPHHTQRPKDYTRYCPGEEQIRISDAVCLGRRRGNFPKCRGCQFNDDEKAAAEGHPVPTAVAIAGNKAIRKAAAPPPDPIESIFKANDIRATSPDPLDRDMAWRIGYASAQFLRSELRGYDRGRTDKSTVIVGRDVRRTSPDLAAGLIDGLRRGGSPVIDIGLIDTPQLYFAVNRLDTCGGVMVTASHNPPQYNGFKICGQRAKPVSVDTGLAKISKIAQNTLRQSGTSQAACETRDVSGEYKAFVRAFLREEGAFADGDRPLKIVVDASNGMAGRWFPVIFGDVDWMEIVPLNFEHAGDFVHDPDPLVETNLRQLCDRMIRSKADLGICFDGDADRCIFVDEQGQIVRGDWLTALLVPVFLRQMPAATVVYDLRSSLVVPEEIRKAGGTPRRERCGHAFIKKALADARGIFAGELSGHYYFRDNFYCDSALIAVAEVINLLNRTGKPLSELIAPLKRYVCSGEHSFPCAHPRAVIDLLADRYATGRVDFLDGVTVQYRDWWFNLRPSITEPMVRLNIEARDPATLQQRLHELTELIEHAAG